MIDCSRLPVKPDDQYHSKSGLFKGDMDPGTFVRAEMIAQQQK